ncbi:MAG: hypothetical protein ACXVDG_10740 [Tumebacillaceae bacterium]
MKRWLLVTWLVSLVLLLVPGIVFAAVSPDAIKQAKQNAPLHVTGVVKADATVRDLSAQYGHPLEIRKMTLEITSVAKKPTDLTLAKGDTLDVYYNWYPASVDMVGPRRIDIAVGDEWELWMKKGTDGWEPVLSGDTIAPIKLIEPRPSLAVPLTTAERFHELWRTYWVPTVFIAIMGIFVGSVYLRAVRRR